LHGAGTAGRGDRGRAARACGGPRRCGQARGGAHVHRDARRRGGRLGHRHDGVARPVRRGRVAALRVPYADAVIEPFTVLAENEDLPRWDVPEELTALYGGAIGLDEPCVVANFVESLDGVVAVPRLPRSHAVIGDESEADRFVLALVRACSHPVCVGSGPLLAPPGGRWRIDRASPPAAEALAELRARRG